MLQEHTVSPHIKVINVHALIFEDAVSFRKQVHLLLFKRKKYFEKRHAFLFEHEMTLITNKW